MGVGKQQKELLNTIIEKTRKWLVENDAINYNSIIKKNTLIRNYVLVINTGAFDYSADYTDFIKH